MGLVDQLFILARFLSNLLIAYYGNRLGDSSHDSKTRCADNVVQKHMAIACRISHEIPSELLSSRALKHVWYSSGHQTVLCTICSMVLVHLLISICLHALQLVIVTWTTRSVPPTFCRLSDFLQRPARLLKFVATA